MRGPLAARLVAGCLSASLAACSGDDESTAWQLSSDPLVVAAVDWNPSAVDVGEVSALAEDADQVVLLGSRGAMVFASGALDAIDTSVTEWRAASRIPAADGAGFWPVGVDGEGRVIRVAPRAVLEDISDRYGLAADPVHAVIPLGGPLVAFALEGAIAVADGHEIIRYDLDATSGASGGAKRIAAVGPGGKIEILALTPPLLTSLRVDGASETAVDAEGRVFVGTAQRIYQVGEVGPAVVYEAPASNLHGLVSAGGRVWFAEGSELGALEGRFVSRTAGAEIPLDASLVASSSGGVWTLSHGKVSHLEIPKTGDEGAWDTTVRPVYVRVCSACHDPGGTSGIDLSSYQAWLDRRAKVYDRVVVKRDMPQGGSLSDADREAIRAWSTP